MKTFPKLTDAEMERLLKPPEGPVRLIIDTDTKNEIDDQFALAWALLSQDQLEIEGILAEPFSFAHLRDGLFRAHELTESGQPLSDADQALVSTYASWVGGLKEVGTHPKDVAFPGPAEGMEGSYQEILTVYKKLGMDPGNLVFRGSPGYLPSLEEPIQSEATDHLIECALKADDRPLYVAAIGCVTNIASAILLEPEIIKNMVVLWTSAYPSWSNQPNEPSLNLVQDVASSKLLFDCGVPHVYLPGYYIGEQLKISLPDMEAWVKDKGAMGEYLHWLYTHNPIYEQRGIAGHFGRTWVIWDLINIAWLLNPSWVPSELVRTPTLNDDTTWNRSDSSRHLMREAFGINRDAIFRDLFKKLDKTP
jgi:hypothetical protein